MKSKIETQKNILQTLKSRIKLFESLNSITIGNSNDCNNEMKLMFRDATILRFRVSVDYFIGLLEQYLTKIELVSLPFFSIESIIQESMEAKILSEDEGLHCIDMIKKRCEIPHAHCREVAESIAEAIPGYYLLMHEIVHRIVSNIKGQ